MTVAVDEADPADVEVAVEAVKKPRVSKRVLIVATAVAIILIGAGLASFLLPRSPAKVAGHGEAEVSAEAYVDVPPLVVNLRSADGNAHMLKLHVMLVPMSAEKSEAITARLPLIIDAFQPFLRELRPEDLAGSMAVFRIKEELLIRANTVTGGGSVRDVLVQDLIQQ